MYYFISFANLQTGKNIGGCAVRAESPQGAIIKARELGLIPKIDTSVCGWAIEDELFGKEEDIKENRFYSSAELFALGYKTEGISVHDRQVAYMLKAICKSCASELGLSTAHNGAVSKINPSEN